MWLALAGLLIGIMLATRTPWRILGRNLVLLGWLLLVTFCVHLWGTRLTWPASSPDLPTWLGGVTLEGLRNGGLAVGQIALAVGWATVLARSTTPLELVAGLERLAAPCARLGVPVPHFAIVTMLSLRFLPILLDEGRRLMRAHIARGVNLDDAPFRQRATYMVLLCVPLFYGLLRRVEFLTIAMESRAFRVHHPRTTFYEFRMRRTDYLVLSGSLLLCVGLLWFPNT